MSDIPRHKAGEPTDTYDPNYFHRVVDCQWACPAHTDVPGYIRLIAQGRYSDAYMLNRASNVFPGILGRVCDRPCEPACRRGRVKGEDETPVAICRLKRVTYDHKDDITDRLPQAGEPNGKRIALIGAGCASLTVANDLAPLGYHCTIFEKLPESGGLMRSNIPRFRLPPGVLDEEIDNIVGIGNIDLKLDSPIDSMKALLDQGFDAVFVGSGAPRGKELNAPGREEAGATGHVHIGIDWLESVAFEHVKEIGERVLIIGAGNTAMDCCRTSLRLGAKDVKVLARKPKDMLKASDWELEDALDEQVDLVTHHSPKAFVVEDGQLVGMTFDVVEYEDDDGRNKAQVVRQVMIECDDVILAIGQENSFPWIERDVGIEFDEWEVPVVDRTTFQSTREGVFFGGDAAFGPENIIWAVRHGHEAAISIHRYCLGESLTDRVPDAVDVHTSKMGLHEWAYSNQFDPDDREVVPQVAMDTRFQGIDIEVELGFSEDQFRTEVERCLNCDIQTIFFQDKCIECDACIDVCPTHCLTMTADADEDELRTRLKAPAENVTQALFVSGGLKQTGRVMVKDEDQCVHCGLCAERCPTAAWDMKRAQIFIPKVGDDEAIRQQRKESA